MIAASRERRLSQAVSPGWVYAHLTDDDGHDVVEACSAGEVHRLEVIPGAESQAG